MKNFALGFLLLFAVSVFAQKKIASRIEHLIETNTTFLPVAPFTLAENNGVADNMVRWATYVTLDTAVARSVFQQQPDHLELTLPYIDTTIVVMLFRTKIAASDFNISTDKQKNVPYVQGSYYRGIIKGDDNSLAAFTFFEGEIYGIVSATGMGNVTVGRLETEGNTKDYILYSDSDVMAPQLLQCAAREWSTEQMPPVHHNASNTLSEKCVTLYFELRHNAFLANGNSVTQTANWFTALFNNVQTIFENDGITTALKSIYVWESPDPYDMTTPSAYDVLDLFASNTPIFDADAGQLIHYGGGMGLAFDIGALCSDLNRSFAMVNPFYQPLPAYSYAVKIMSHELGHTLGSPHTHGCYWNGNNTAIDGCSTPEGDCAQGPLPADGAVGTIMSYCGNINFANGFGPQPTQRILQHIAASQCLGTDCINSCTNTISSLSLTDATFSTATLTWSDQQSTLWEIGYAAYGSEITNWQVITQNNFTIVGLTSNTYYTFSVRRLCGAGTAAGAKTLSFCTGANWCGGAVWTDTGGINGDYTEEQRSVTIIKPTVPGQMVSVTFNDFWTQLRDIMYVYDGVGTSAPLLGSWSGYTEPSEPYTATNPTGALTFEFITGMGVYPSDGWAATVVCNTLSIDAENFANLTYYPNPVSHTLTLNLPKGLDTITLYTIAGQLLVQKQPDATTYSIDMQSYASGVYLLKLISGSEITHIKVIKQ